MYFWDDPRINTRKVVIKILQRIAWYDAQNPLHMLSRNFPVDRKAANLLATRPTSPQQVGNKSL